MELQSLFHKDLQVTINIEKYKLYNESMLPEQISFINKNLDDKGVSSFFFIFYFIFIIILFQIYLTLIFN